jgi:putative ABC transport system permease protein
MPSNLFNGLFGDIYGRDNGGPEMFFLSGVMLVVATTLLMIENGEAFAGLVNRIGGRLGSIRPALATAIAYPMASKLRTGMTLAMFSLIIFSITVMSTVNSNFTRMLLSRDATGGWDVTATTNLNNPIPDLRAALTRAGVDTAKLAEIGATTPIEGLSDVRNQGATGWQRYNIRAADSAFLDASTMKLQAHVRGDNGADVWKELQKEPGTAVIDANAVNSNQGSGNDEPNFQLKGVGQNATLLNQPITIDVRNAAGEVSQLKVIGVITKIVANAQNSIFTSAGTYQQTMGVKPVFTQYSISLTPGTDD